MAELSKKIRQELRKLSKLAYTRELDNELAKLAEQVDQWKNKTIDGFILSDAIYQFHDHAARELYKMYSHQQHNLMLVARAYSLKLLEKTELSNEMLEEVERFLVIF